MEHWRFSTPQDGHLWRVRGVSGYRAKCAGGNRRTWAPGLTRRISRALMWKMQHEALWTKMVIEWVWDGKFIMFSIICKQ